MGTVIKRLVDLTLVVRGKQLVFFTLIFKAGNQFICNCRDGYAFKDGECVPIFTNPPTVTTNKPTTGSGNIQYNSISHTFTYIF